MSINPELWVRTFDYTKLASINLIFKSASGKEMLLSC